MLHNKSILSKLTDACNVSVVKARANSEKSALFSVLVAEREQERERESEGMADKIWVLAFGGAFIFLTHFTGIVLVSSYCPNKAEREEECLEQVWDFRGHVTFYSRRK